MRNDILNILSFWIISWYTLDSFSLILSYLMNWAWVVFIPISDEEFPSILSKVIVIIILSINWPIYFFVISGACTIGFEGASISYLLHHPFIWYLSIAAAISFAFTIILWKNDILWKIRWYQRN